MANENQVTIKLSPEQIREKEIQLFKTKMNLEMAELNINQFVRAINENIPQREAETQLNNMRKQVEQLKHNIGALTEQITKGEM